MTGRGGERSGDPHEDDDGTAHMGVGLGVALGLCLGAGIAMVFGNWALTGVGLMAGLLLGLAYDHRGS